MKAATAALLFVLALSACAQPSPDVKSAGWEQNVGLLNTPAAPQ